MSVPASRCWTAQLALKDFGAIDGDVGRSLDSDADASALNRKNLDAAISDNDFLFDFAGQDQHDDTSLIECAAVGQATRGPETKKALNRRLMRLRAAVAYWIVTGPKRPLRPELV